MREPERMLMKEDYDFNSYANSETYAGKPFSTSPPQLPASHLDQEDLHYVPVTEDLNENN